MPAAVLIGVMSLGGLLNGMIQPSRDMMVRAVTPPGSFGKVFGFVSTGFNLGGMVAPLLYGWLMDHGEPRAIFMIVVGLHPPGAGDRDHPPQTREHTPHGLANARRPPAKTDALARRYGADALPAAGPWNETIADDARSSLGARLQARPGAGRHAGDA